MNSRRFHRIAVLAILGGFACSCSKEVVSDIPQTGPAYILTTEGTDQDVQDVLLEILQERMKPVRVTSKQTLNSLGTIHVAMRIYSTKFENSRSKEMVDIPRQLSATVTVDTTEGSSNWDGEHSIGFETESPVSFYDSAKARRHFAKRLLEVAVKQLPGRGDFEHESLSAAQPAK